MRAKPEKVIYSQNSLANCLTPLSALMVKESVTVHNRAKWDQEEKEEEALFKAGVNPIKEEEQAGRSAAFLLQ